MHGDAVDHAGHRAIVMAQDHTTAMQAQPRVLRADVRSFDADVGLARGADHAAGLDRKRPAMVATADPAQHDAWIGLAAAWRRMRGLGGDLAADQDFHTVGVDRIAGAQHRHAPHRASVDVDPAHARRHLQPQAAAIQADLDQQCTGDGIAHADVAARFAHDAVDTRAKCTVGGSALREMETEVLHAARA